MSSSYHLTDFLFRLIFFLFSIYKELCQQFMPRRQLSTGNSLNLLPHSSHHLVTVFGHYQKRTCLRSRGPEPSIAGHSQAQQRRKQAAPHRQFWRVVRHCFSLSQAQGWGMLAVECLPPCLCLKNNRELLPSCRNVSHLVFVSAATWH